jgi:hypothetical protein
MMPVHGSGGVGKAAVADPVIRSATQSGATVRQRSQTLDGTITGNVALFLSGLPKDCVNVKTADLI